METYPEKQKYLKGRQKSMKQKLNFKHKTIQDKNSISSYLKMLASAFKGGNLIFRNDKEQIIMKFNNTMEFKIKASKKKEKSKLVITFNWIEK